MDADDRIDVVEAMVADHIERAARDALFSRLKHEPQPPGQLVAMVCEVERRAEYHGGVYVVPACMGDSGNLASIGHVFVVVHGQRIKVGAKGHHGLTDATVVKVVIGAIGRKITHEAGADGQHARMHPCQFEAFPHQLGRRVLGAAQFRVGMHVSAECNQALTMFSKPTGQAGVR